jgi:hypothetical protein
MKYVVSNSTKAAISTNPPTMSPATPPTSQRAAFQIKEAYLDNGHLKIRATVGPTDSALHRDQVP